MKKKIVGMIGMAVLAGTLFAGCGGTTENGNENEAVQPSVQTEAPSDLSSAELADGIYSVDVETYNSMFHVNEACDGKGTLTVENGQMSVHISLVSKNIVNLFCGTAEDAQKDGAVWLEPTTDPVTYSDGWTEEVYGFDIPVETLGEDFPIALVGKKGTWYDHTMCVSNPEPMK